jgi:hypothetical protein
VGAPSTISLLEKSQPHGVEHAASVRRGCDRIDPQEVTSVAAELTLGKTPVAMAVLPASGVSVLHTKGLKRKGYAPAPCRGYLAGSLLSARVFYEGRNRGGHPDCKLSETLPE